MVRSFSAGYFHFRPFCPEIDPSCSLDKISNVGTTYARRSLQEVQLSVSTFDELAVRHAAHHAKRLKHLLIEGAQRNFIVTTLRQGPRRKNVALMRNVHGRTPVLARDRKQQLLLVSDRVDVE